MEYSGIGKVGLMRFFENNDLSNFSNNIVKKEVK